MDEIIKKIVEWGNDRGINNPDKQFDKLAEEKKEAYEAYLTLKHLRQYTPIFYGAVVDLEARNHLKEELGDIGVAWVILCDMLGVSPIEALEMAHEKNKDRKGVTIEGNFIKDEDLK